ncbi:MAG: hypothetical protein D6800_09175 [Candidatus Zixiibacteriota bacterium]|nr:MAG: hypothetical protein D6800_09175 [candidate division Zixibacteria bacterium]
MAALPEVDWFVRIQPTEPMYLYKSRFGARHFLGERYSFEGRPVMIRYNTGLFRTAHSLFGPYGFDDAQYQQLIESMLEWLFNGRIGQGSTSIAEMLKPDPTAPDPAYSKRLIDQYWEARDRQLEMKEPVKYDVRRPLR